MAIFCLLLGAVELVARANGINPMIGDSMGVWCLARERASELGEDGIILVGDSKMVIGVVPKVLSEHCSGREVAMLAVDGFHPLATLEDLAKDEKIQGTIVCSLNMWSLLPTHWDAQKEYVEFFKSDWTLRRKLSVQARVLVEESLALFHENLSYASLLKALQGDPYVNYVETTSSRHKRSHFSRVDHRRLADATTEAELQEKATYEAFDFPSPEDMEAHYARLEVSVEKLLAKGCRVIFVGLPTSGMVWTLDDRFWPKHDYWDNFSQQTRAETIHFKDYASLSSFECPDNVHLDYGDAIKFTAALAKILRSEHGPLKSPPTSP